MEERAAKILNDTSNRYYPLPNRPWKYFQQWRNTILLHWEADADVIAKDLPPNISLDTFNGKAWLSLVAFSVSDSRIGSLPLPALLGAFEEINFRTYVTHNGLPGIYMFSVEADKTLVKWMFRLFSGIRYTKATIGRAGNRIHSAHPSKGFSLDFTFGAGTAIREKTPLDIWLTERHCVYAPIGDNWHRFDIHHKPWPLESCTVKIGEVRYHTQRFSTKEKQPQAVHFSRSIDVLLWSRKRVDRLQ